MTWWTWTLVVVVGLGLLAMLRYMVPALVRYVRISRM